MKDKISKLDDENKELIRKMISLIRENMSHKRENNCLRAIIKRQAARIDGFKPLFWRIYWK
jgi:hypothetical protein